MNPLIAIISSTDWLFVAIATILSLVASSIWFHQNVFGNAYCTWMNLPKPNKENMSQGMGITFLIETLSRVLYFAGLCQAFIIAGWDNMGNGIVLALVVWAIFVFSTQMSFIAWTNHDKKALLLIGGNILMQSLIGGVLWYAFFA